ncbi:MAG: homocysteine S-methyltransferase [Rhodothermia bacterium]|nr:MAG: homocysteine S-methyltransferase [Rhodothermia bacterium]
MVENPIISIVQNQRVVILDGGLATTLENRGHSLNHELWSAKLLLEDLEAIRQVHLDFLSAGADCITTATYQATSLGFQEHGLTEQESVSIMRQAVELATVARNFFWSTESNRMGRTKPLVAASIGPYGAYLADGSEYTGDYDIEDEQLYEFHRARWEILHDCGADLFACETIPSQQEAKVLLRVFTDHPETWVWLSFCCRDKQSLRDGSSFGDMVQACSSIENVAAIGVNCTSPDHISALVSIAREVTTKPVLVYPNAGEKYDPVRKEWIDSPANIDWSIKPAEWVRLGATGIGGCCRIGPERIRELRRLVLPEPSFSASGRV